MTNADLAVQLNEKLVLAGADRVTVDTIRQWVSWGLLPKATVKNRAKGDWNRDDQSLSRAVRLAQLRKLGVRRKCPLIVQCYLDWRIGDFERVRAALLVEFRRGAASIRKPISSDTKFDNFHELSVTRKRALRHQAGPLDDQFRDTIFEQSNEFYITALKSILNERGAAEQLSELFSSALAKLNLPIGDLSMQPIAMMLAAAVEGLFGDADEIAKSGDQAITTSNERDFRIARIKWKNLFQFWHPNFDWERLNSVPLISEPLRIAITETGAQIGVGRWAISSFAALLRIPEIVAINPQLSRQSD